MNVEIAKQNITYNSVFANIEAAQFLFLGIHKTFILDSLAMYGTVGFSFFPSKF
jgi:hypothetical protein